MSRKSFISVTAIVAVTGLGASIASADIIDINGGSSWSGWSHRGNSLDVGIWGSGSTTRSYELYTTSFTFTNNTVTGGNQIRAGSTPTGFVPGAFSTGAFANGNTIFGIGGKMNGTARAVGQTFVAFGLSGNDFHAASSLGAGDGCVSYSSWGHAGDFSVWMNHDSSPTGPSELSVLKTNGTLHGGSGVTTSLAGGYGSGVSYDYAIRMFSNGDVGGSFQMFFDLTAMQNLYSSSGSNYISNRWSNGLGSIGSIGSNFNIRMYNADEGHINSNQIVFAVPAPGTAALLGIGGLLAARRRR